MGPIFGMGRSARALVEVMARYKGRMSPKTIERDFPHAAEIDAEVRAVSNAR